MSAATARQSGEPQQDRTPRGDGPWLIRSHYWNSWHRRGSDGGACGYTADILHAGVFGAEKARAYNDGPEGTNEAIPISEALPALELRAADLARDHAAAMALIDIARKGLAGTGAA